MRCATRIQESASAAPAPLTYEAEMAEMNRARTRMFTQLRCLGHDPVDALSAVNAATLRPVERTGGAA